LAITLAVLFAGGAAYAIQSVHSVPEAFAIALCAELAGVGLACVIDARPWRRHRGVVQRGF
jgi:hypothetical protein